MRRLAVLQVSWNHHDGRWRVWSDFPVAAGPVGVLRAHILARRAAEKSTSKARIAEAKGTRTLRLSWMDGYI